MHVKNMIKYTRNHETICIRPNIICLDQNGHLRLKISSSLDKHIVIEFFKLHILQS